MRTTEHRPTEAIRDVADRLSFLSAPLTRDRTMPLRAQVHSRILDGIRTGRLTPGSMLPTEADLGRLLGVSRTVVREALMLLDEDGFIVSRRGIGRFVADTLPQIGLERIRPLEQLLETPGSIVGLHRTLAMLQPRTSTFVIEELGLAPDDGSWFFETVIRRDGEPIALSQEHFAAAGALDPEQTAAVTARMTDGPVTGSLLSLLIERYGPALGTGVVRFTAGILGESRATALGADADEPALILTQTARLEDTVVYLAKHLIRPGAGQLSVMQS
ncbi:GntR family transcriptional regulator [Actinoplanes sp. DH11]|uniref:GntR family transcriptional regulator n=1 Tax=Actinoplanes sp. DH11 TaxID=2857011 RepID=UPI001E642452|nr:GntR family transcriptional regulator [Actinoplanes sp. DH11]